MDWGQVASAAATLLSAMLPYLGKAGESVATEVGKKIGSATWQKTRKLTKAILQRISEDDVAEQVLTMASEAPTNESRRTTLAEKLANMAESDSSFGQQLIELTDLIAQDQEVMKFVTQIHGGEVGKIVNIGRARDVNL